MRALQLRFFPLAVILSLVAPMLYGCSGSDPVSDDTGESGSIGDGITVSGSQVRIDVTSERGAPLETEGGFVFVEEVHTIVINAAGTVRAFSSVCSADACDVSQFVDGEMRCACDNSTFSSSGLPLAGAARAPLERYTVTRSGDLVIVTRPSSEPDPDPTPPPPSPYY